MIKRFENAPFNHANIRLFIAFRVFYNARFYYPVFTILFLDFGLTLEQFTLLNVVWAMTIVLLEVPSGALADLFGRRRLLIATSLLMIAELSLISFAPSTQPEWIFYLFLANRLLSGTSEAMGSGADEALAYDTLVDAGQKDLWPKVLDVQLKVQQIGFIVAMTLGALVYDPELLNRIAEWIGINGQLTLRDTMRYPLLLTLGSALVTLVLTVKMTEPPNTDQPERQGFFATAFATTRLIIDSARWIWHTPFALGIILFTMLFDHIIRMLLTLNSQYYRMIDIPEALFGVIGSSMSVMAYFIPPLAVYAASRFRPVVNLSWMSILMMIGCTTFALFIPWYGVLPMALVFMVFMFNMFFGSHYLNQVTPSHMRATVLSFRGLSFNLAYAAISLAYTGTYAWFKQRAPATLSAAQLERHTFMITSEQFLGYFVMLLIVLCAIVLVAQRAARNRESSEQQG
jgi:MFS family permease